MTMVLLEAQQLTHFIHNNKQSVTWTLGLKIVTQNNYLMVVLIWNQPTMVLSTINFDVLSSKY